MKKRINRYGKGVMLTLLVSVGTMFVGCSDELFDESEGKQSFIRFNVSTTQMEESRGCSRSIASEAGDNAVLAAEGKHEEKPLYVHEEKMGCISAHNNIKKAQSRGSFVTDDNFFSKFRVMGKDNNDNDLLGGWQTISEISNWQSISGWPKDADNMRFWAYAAPDEAIANNVVSLPTQNQATIGNHL